MDGDGRDEVAAGVNRPVWEGACRAAWAT
ncbi:hypothetical protein ACFQXA_05445 [Nocardiopsis composta]